jgi:hypothetical protein
MLSKIPSIFGVFLLQICTDMEIGEIYEELKDCGREGSFCKRCCGVGLELSGRSVGRLLEGLREKAELSREDLAERMDVSEVYVRHMESGVRRVSFEMLKRYLEALG